MGNSLHNGISNSLPYRIRYNDSTLTELGLTTSLDDDEELTSIIQALPRNHTIRVVVLFDSFTSYVLHQQQSSRPLVWNEFVQALASVSSLQQVELLETCVPLDSLCHLLQKRTLQTLAITDGVDLGSITSASIMILGAAITNHNGTSALQEFVWECQFPTRENLLDPLLVAFTCLSQLKLLGLVNSSSVPRPSSVALLSPERLTVFCRQQRSTLQTLDLSGCGINNHHLQGICQGLSHGKGPCTMERLHLQRNRTTNNDTMLDFVQSNHHCLTALLMDGDDIFQAKVRLWMAWNNHVRKVLGQEPTLLALRYMVLRVQQQPDFLFLLLREYPEIYMKKL